MENKRSTSNLCNTYVLPLLGLNRWSFGTPAGFINSYVSEDDNHIVVECSHPHTAVIMHHANYRFGFTKERSHFAVFDVPAFYKEDVKKFRQGKYSKFTEQAKSLIRSKSGLSYRVKTPPNKYASAVELLALEKDQELKKHLETKLDVKLSEEAELMSIPSDNNFYNLNLSTELESIV